MTKSMTGPEKIKFGEMQENIEEMQKSIKGFSDNTTKMQGEFGAIQKDIHDIKNSYTSFGPTLQAILSALTGNTLTGDGGMIKRLVLLETNQIHCEEINKKSFEKITERVDKMEKANIPNETRLKALWWIFGMIGGGIITYIMFILLYKK